MFCFAQVMLQPYSLQEVFYVQFSRILKWWKAERWCLQHFALWLGQVSHRYCQQCVGIPDNRAHYFGEKVARLLNWQQYFSQSFHIFTWRPWLHILCGSRKYPYPSHGGFLILYPHPLEFPFQGVIVRSPHPLESPVSQKRNTKQEIHAVSLHIFIY